ncbi:SGNH/GDSL hydrolase family protein [Geodermatophilus sp. DSM 44513]|uniref:SGNH/GDSL hydrolase family protein n=1 Tax=Geodermatophilus sp. DSM 44513 TaxID=1528104 RepID=UPI00127D1E12|nr:SGNH/GDSL hydrolase family protein [Geodermatophilus sp. DSM 44513]WNV74769.1 SGNH/GDSL hydrolase family protein [Geodermatophilus sp. DSM 44513]
MRAARQRVRSRRRRLGALTAVLTAGLGVGALLPATAQSGPVAGAGNHFLLSGAGDTSGVAAERFWFGRADDEVYLGDVIDRSGALVGDGRDDVLVRRGNTFTVRGAGGRTFAYGDPGDTVLVGDWDGDGTDTLAVRRGNSYFLSNSLTSGVADAVVVYGDPGDVVLVGNWDGDTSAADAPRPVTTDTLMVRRGHHYFVKNSLATGVADADFFFGEPGDTVLVGDWATAPGPGTPGRSGDSADQLAVRRGNVNHLSAEVWTARRGSALPTRSSVAYGEPGDTAFAAQLPRTYPTPGGPQTVYGDGFGVRRAGVPAGTDTPPAPAAPSAADGGVRTYAAVGDSITAGFRHYDHLGAPGPSSWLQGETAGRLQLAGGWAVPGTTTAQMLAHVAPADADVLVLLGGTNDVIRGVPWEVTAGNLQAIAAKVGARNTLAVGIVPIGWLPGAREQFNARLAALASEQGWRYVDPWLPLTAGDRWAPGASPDDLHPTPQAAFAAGRTIADAAWQAAARRGPR